MKAFGAFLDGYSNVASQLWDNLRDRTFAALYEHTRQKEAITSPEGVVQRARRIRATFLDSIGGLPPQDTPLNPRVLGAIPRRGYRIEKVIFESQPCVYVTSSLYVPDGLKAPAPGVLFVSGHSYSARMYDQYQRVCIELARGGFVVLAIDPTGQGERITEYDPASGKPAPIWGTLEHSYQGQPCILTGTNIARYFLHDAKRAIDYLQSRPEVDGERIGVTGNSGGGTQTTLLCMSGDERVKAAVPCTYVTSREHYYLTGQPQDAEQLQFAMTAHGINFDDMFYPFAPRPLLIGAVQFDFFSPEGTALTYERLERMYGLFGKADHVGLAWAPGTHAYHAQLREAAVNWFRRHLSHEPPDFRTDDDDEIQTLPEAELQCTPQCHVPSQFPDTRTPYHLNIESLAPRPKYARLSDLRAAVIDTLGLRKRMQTPCEMFSRTTRVWADQGLTVESVILLSEPGIQIAGALAYASGTRPETGLVFLADGGAERFDEHLPKVAAMARDGRAVFVCDVRGKGLLKPNPVNPHSDQPPRAFFGTEGWLASSAYCLGESLLGMRVFDVLRAARFLRHERGFKRVALHAEGLEPGLWGYLAAAVDEDIAETRVDGLLESFEAVVRAPNYRTDLTPAMLVHGVLRHFDLPDLEALFDGRVLETTPLPAAESMAVAAV